MGNTISVKMLVIAGLSVGLLIPVAFVHSVIDERKQRRNEAVAEITSTWGSHQSVVGPVLVVPYRYQYPATVEERFPDGRLVRREVMKTAVENAYFLPSELKIEGSLDPKRLHRGIYEAVVYSGRVKLSGQFPAPDWKALKIDPADALWSEALVTIAVPDLRGAKGAIELKLGGKTHVMLPGTRLPGFAQGAHVPVGEGAREFSLGLDLNGSGGIQFAPLGVRNLVSLQSAWPDPKFQGSFLPVERQVGSGGFSARWDVSYYGRSFPQQSTDRSGRPEQAAVTPSLFGVTFLPAIDSYRNVERSTKYAILFIAMVFLAFFLFEVLAALRIHPVQYVLVGLALALFFIVLLSLSEFLPFWLAYLAAASAATAMISLYGAKFLGGARRTSLLAGELVLVYGYLYVVLQRQDFSLLMGSAMLIAALGALMYLTRDVDWYKLERLQGG